LATSIADLFFFPVRKIIAISSGSLRALGPLISSFSLGLLSMGKSFTLMVTSVN